MKTNDSQLKTEIVRLLSGRTELKIHPMYSGAVLALAAEGKVSQKFDGEHFIVTKP